MVLRNSFVPGKKTNISASRNFDRATAFETQYLWIAIKGRAHTRCIAVLLAISHLRPALNGSSDFKRSDAIMIRDGIMFVFYPGLAQINSLGEGEFFLFFFSN